MVHWKLDSKARARLAQERAVQWMKKHAPRSEELKRFQAEAEALIEVK